MVELGDNVKDPITGYKGIAYSRTTYLQGCDRIGVQAPMQKDLSVPELFWVDEPQLEVISVKKVKKGEGDNGGPLPYKPKRQFLPPKK